VDALRTAYRRELVAIAGRDLSGELPLRAVTEHLADLAGATLQAALAVAAAGLPPDAERCRLAIIAMGKTGGRELNYVSDVDVVFVGEPGEGPDAPGDTDRALATATALARETMRLCHLVAWEVDAALRPEGKAGPLVRTLGSHENYYRRWASTWEFQALLKARPVAGDPDLGARYAETIAPFVWTAAERPGFVADVRAMRRRVVEHIPSRLADRELKLGPGGLRDVEFAVQLLQLVHGRGDESLRVPGTLPALDALRDGGFIGRKDAAGLIAAYTFLRETEHRLQLRRLRRTHVVPDDPEQRAWLGRALGFLPGPEQDPQQVWDAAWNRYGHEVRRLHEKLFYRPLLEAVARVPTEGLRLTPAEARRRLEALGFADPAGALRHIEALTAGVTRTAVLQRALLPVILSDLADAPDPDGGLLAYRQISEHLGRTHWYLGLLRDEGIVATRLAFLLGTSRYVTRMLGRAPEALRLLANDEELRPRPAGEIVSAMRESAARHAGAADAVAVVRGLRRQELLRTAFADLLGRLPVEDVGAALSATTEATLDAALRVALQDVAGDEQVAELPLRFALIAVGRLGGAEIGYGSDADVLFVYENAGPDDAGRQALAVAARLRLLLAAPSSPDPPLTVDADLRPEGRDGPLARSLAAYQRYYERWSAPWEAQALLRARFAAGDPDLGRRFIAMIDPIRYPADGLTPVQLTEIRRIKGRVDAERLPRGADPTTHLKLGRGGLADVEWTVQLLQLQHGARVLGLRTTRTLAALDAAAAEGLLSGEQAAMLGASWRLATRIRNAIMLVRDRAQDQIPHRGTALVGVGRALGYPPGFDPGELVDEYRRTARRARAVVETVFYGPR
jgi:glutamate-ammonia-ligase adenylyltransferase